MAAEASGKVQLCMVSGRGYYFIILTHPYNSSCSLEKCQSHAGKALGKCQESCNTGNSNRIF